MILISVHQRLSAAKKGLDVALLHCVLRGLLLNFNSCVFV